MTAQKNKHKINIYDLQSNIFAEFIRGVQLGFVNLWRNRLLSVATIFVMAVMIVIFNCILAVNFISRQALQNLNQKVDIVFYLKEGTDYYTASTLATKIKEIPGVKNVTYISKDQALEIISKSYPATSDFLTKFNLKNPLPASISITTDTAENHLAVYDFIKSSALYQYIDDSSVNGQQTNDKNILASTAQNLININSFVKQLVFWVIFIFIIGGSLIIINAIQLTIFTRRNEIYVMRLVGATPNFIRLPFITEGLIYALVSVSLSFFLIYLASQFIGLQNLQIFQNFDQVNLVNIFLTELLVAGLLSLISSITTVEQYIKKNLIYS